MEYKYYERYYKNKEYHKMYYMIFKDRLKENARAYYHKIKNLKV